MTNQATALKDGASVGETSALNTDSLKATSAPAPGTGPDRALVLDELLVEDVSIDGMCGVY